MSVFCVFWFLQVFGFLIFLIFLIFDFHLKNISHPSLFSEEGPSCLGFWFTLTGWDTELDNDFTKLKLFQRFESTRKLGVEFNVGSATAHRYLRRNNLKPIKIW